MIVDDSACAFAADFANIVLRSFVTQFLQTQAAMMKAVEDAKPKIAVN